MLFLQHQPNRYRHALISKYYQHEAVPIDYRTITATL